MASVDRADLIALLDRLGAENDETVVQAARELHRRVSEAGVTWADLLRTQPDTADVHGTLGEDVAEDTQTETDGGASTSEMAEMAEIARLIDRLLARKNLSETMREDLAEMKRAMAEGNLDAMDSRYVRALAKRLGL